MEKAEKVNRKLIFWSVVISVTLIFLYYIRQALAPFLLGFIIAYLCLPFISFLEKHRIPRSIASGLTVVFLFIIFLSIFALLFPFLYERAIYFINNGDNILANNFTFDTLTNILNIDNSLFERIKYRISSYIYSLITGAIESFSSTSIVSKIISYTAMLIVMPIITFYMLKDWYKIKKSFLGLMPQRYTKTVKTIIFKIDESIFAYLNGQAKVCMFFAVFYAIGLLFSGLNFGFLIGIIIGLMLFVPYVGFFVGLIISTIVAILQFGFTIDLLPIFALFGIGQLIDANYTTPKFVGETTGVHPVWIVFGLFACTKIFGITGAIMALPITVSVNVLIKFGIQKYKHSPYYK